MSIYFLLNIFMSLYCSIFRLKKNWPFLKISQNLQENTCFGMPFLIKLQVWDVNFIEKGDSDADVFL